MPENLVSMMLSATEPSEEAFVPQATRHGLARILSVEYEACVHSLHRLRCIWTDTLGLPAPELQYVPHIESRYISREQVQGTRIRASSGEERNPAFITLREHTPQLCKCTVDKSYEAQLPNTRLNFVISSSGMPSKEMGIEQYNQS
jgi:hypothetical protein